MGKTVKVVCRERERASESELLSRFAFNRQKHSAPPSPPLKTIGFPLSGGDRAHRCGMRLWVGAGGDWGRCEQVMGPHVVHMLVLRINA